MSKVELESLLEKRKELDARIKGLQARAAEQKRKEDTRRKILVGALVLDEHQKKRTMDTLVSQLDSFLNKDGDRALFGLAPKVKVEEAQEV